MKQRTWTVAAALAAGLTLAACDCGKPAAPAAPGARQAPASSGPGGATTAAANQPGAAGAGPASGNSVVLATLPDEEAARVDSSPSRTGPHFGAIATPLEFIFGERGGVVWAAERENGLQVIHNGREGRIYPALGGIVLSADGGRCAHGALVDGKWRMVVDGVPWQPFDAIESPAFSPDGKHLAYLGLAGDRWHLVVDSTLGPSTSTRFQRLAFSADSSRIAYVTDVDDSDRGRLVLSDLAFKAPRVVEPGASGLLRSEDRSGVAVVSSSGKKQRVVTVAFDTPDKPWRGPEFDTVSRLAFAPRGTSVAYLGERVGKRYLVLGERMEPLTAGDPVDLPAVRPGLDAVGILLSSGGSVRFHQPLGGGPAGEGYEEAEAPSYAPDGSTWAYGARRGDRWFLVVGGKEGPPFDRVVTPTFSPDGQLVAYRVRQDGRRFVVVADREGRTVRRHPPYEQVFPARFTADGNEIAYGVKDGRQLVWKKEPR